MKIKSIHKIVCFFIILILFITGCTNETTKKEVAKPEPSKNEQKAATNAVPIIKQHGELPGTVSPAFSGDELAALPTKNWITNGGNSYNQRYSPLDLINTTNVSSLKGKWVAHFESGKDFKYSGEATPLVYDGVMYVNSANNDVLALDVKTGKTIWEYRPQVTQELTTVCCGWTSRGVAIGDGKVFVGLLDARLVALDQKTGKVVWETKVAEWENGYTITSAPLYYDGKVYTGVAGGEYGVRGRLTAFDAQMGREIWRFYTIPGPGEEGYDSWPHKNNETTWLTGGAPVWQTPAVDPETNTLYFSTGNAAPDVDGSKREGDNLFTDSILAIDAQNGKYKWHFQEVHHDIWDLDAPNPVVLFDTTIDGKAVKGLGQAGKTGWLYLLDRTNGKPLVGINETPVPQNENQKTAKTQPIPVGDSFIPNTLTIEEIKKDIPDFKGEFGNIFTPFWDTPVLIKPMSLGGANWPPSAYSPDTDYYYVLANDNYNYFSHKEEDTKEFNKTNIKGGEMYLGSSMVPANGIPTKGTITALDVKTNKIAWQVKLNNMPYSGALVTKGGLLFVGNNDGRLIAYDAKTGDVKWEFQTGAGANAPAVTYDVDGVQYLSIVATGNSLSGSKHSDTIWTFSLDGKLDPVANKKK